MLYLLTGCVIRWAILYILFLSLFLLPAPLYKVSLLSVTSTLPPRPLRLAIANLPVQGNFRPRGWHLPCAATSEAALPRAACWQPFPSCAALLLRCLFAKTILTRRDDDVVNAEISNGTGPGDINPGPRWGLPLDFLVTQSSKCCFVRNQTDLIHFTPARKASPVTQAMTSLSPPFAERPFVTGRCHSLGTSAVRYWRFILFSRTSPVFPILGVACSFALVSTCLKKQPALGLVDWRWPKDLYQSGGRALGLCSSLPACFRSFLSLWLPSDWEAR